MKNRYEAYKNSVADYIDKTGQDTRLRYRMTYTNFEKYSINIGKTPDEFTAVELRDMLLSARPDQIDNKRKWSRYIQIFRGYYNYLI